MSQIATEAAVTKSLLHHYFGSKENLWTEVKTRRFAVYADHQLAMLERADSDVNLLMESMKTYFHFLKDNPEMVRILAWVFLERQQDTCMTMDQGLMEAGAAKVAESQARGEIRADLNPHFILFTMVGIVQHWFQDRAHVLERLDGVDPDAVDQAYLGDVVKIFFEGILPR
jgi:TetR/AcrR family transcriptional regulator